MKKNNRQTIILRTGLALSMLAGIGLQTHHVSAAEQIEPSSQEERTDEKDFVEELQKDFIENDKEHESDEKEESSIDQPIEENDNFIDYVAEEIEINNILHNEEWSPYEDIETSEMQEEETQKEEVLTDEVTEVTEYYQTDDSGTDDVIIEYPLSEVTLKNDEIAEEEKIAVVNQLNQMNNETETKDLADSKSVSSVMTMSTSSNHSEIKVDRIQGSNRFKNAVEISKKGWSTAPKVYLANGHKFADSLTGSPLAALHNAPILLTRDNILPEETLNELKRLNTKEVVILGGELSVSNNIVNTLARNGITVARIGGNNRYTQAELVANEIMKAEGKNRDAFLASGELFSDALSIATVASNKRLPIFLTRESRLEQTVLNAIPYVNSWTIIGGESTINKSVENQMKNAGAKTQRIGGKDRYEVNRNVFNFYGTPEEHLYVTSGEHYSDTLPASVLASKENSGVLLLRNNRKSTNEEQQFFAQNKQEIKNFTFVGGTSTLSEKTKDDFSEVIRTVDNDMLEFIAKQYNHYTLSEYNIRLIDALDMQMVGLPQTDKRYTAFVSKDYINSNNHTVSADILNVRSGAGSAHHIIAQLRKGNKVDVINETNDWYQIDLKQYWLNANQEDTEYYLNPNNFVHSEQQMFQFLDLTRSTGATAEQLNLYLKGKGILEGTGQAFIEAGQKHGVNEVYLLSHALLETGHGTSTLAKGVQLNGNKVYNVFGIGAFDSDPVGYGSLKALEEQWFTPEEAIIGGAAFIGNNYVKAGQNTLYKMRWNPDSMSNNGYSTHQYATDIGWASKQVYTIYNLYNSIGIDLNHVDIPVYIA